MVKRIVIQPIPETDSAYSLGLRYQVDTPNKERIYFYDMADAMRYVDGFGVTTAQLSLF